MSIITGEFLMSSIDRSDLISIIDNNPSLRGYLQGYIAESKLQFYLSSLPEVSNVYKIADHHERKGDFAFTFQGREWTVELKSASTSRIKEDHLEGGISGSVRLKNPSSKLLFSTQDGEVRASNLKRGSFDILAISMVSMTGEWSFKFIANEKIKSSPNLPDDYLTSQLPINTDNTLFLRDSILEVIKYLS